ncbi:hypothetical protein [Arthrobacter sp. NPDC092385]|uniref:hypothetical protein n=1 Tax=Arthrobacter sp. NPDC092385 TaxID=3363943 RepID=UPI003815DA3E
MIELVGLAVRIAFAALVESFPYWSLSGRRTYRDYLRAVQPGVTALSRREWRAAGRSGDPRGSS